MIQILILVSIALVVIFYFAAIRFSRQLLIVGTSVILIGSCGFGLLNWGPKDFFVRFSLIHPWVLGWISICLFLFGCTMCIGASARFIQIKVTK